MVMKKNTKDLQENLQKSSYNENDQNSIYNKKPKKAMKTIFWQLVLFVK